MQFVTKNCLVLLRNFVNNFKSLCINMRLSSLNILEENQFYEIKKKNI